MPDLTIQTVCTVHQRKYVRLYKFEPISPATWHWMGNSLEALAQRSELTPVALSTAVALDHGICLAKSIRSWRTVVAKPLAQLKASEIISAFQALEQSLEESDFSNYSSVVVGRTFRNFVTSHVAAGGQPILAKRIQSTFRSNLMRPSKSGRDLISDLPKPGRAPVGAVMFGSYAELKEATLTTLRDDLADILRCCEDVLERYELALAFLDDLEHLNIPSSEVERIGGKSNRLCRKRVAENWSTEDLKIYLSLIKKGKIAPCAERREEKYRKLRYHPAGAKELLVASLRGMSNGAHIKHLMRLEVAPPSDVLLACALILQIHTHWNFISVLELKASDVLVTKFPHRLQSVKPRTSDETPVVFVERTDELVIRALAHIRNRWERLVAAGIIGSDDGNLWFSAWFLKGRGPPQPIVSWSRELREFTKAYKLPSFTLEQVRVQCLALVATTRRSLGGATQSAGHMAGSTTLRYIDKALLRRLNSANLLEFERRLENTILYEMGRPASVRRLSNLSLGDGTQCADPLRPPNPAWMSAGICAGEMCHQGDGCPHRRIIIDRARLEEVIRSKSYYVSNWKRLADENSVRFERVHVPQMLFSLALYGVVKKGPYRHLVARFEK